MRITQKVKSTMIVSLCMLFFYLSISGMQKDFCEDGCCSQSGTVFSSIYEPGLHDSSLEAVINSSRIQVPGSTPNNSPQSQPFLEVEAPHRGKQKTVFPSEASVPPILDESLTSLGQSQKNLLPKTSSESPQEEDMSVLSRDEEDVLGKYFSEKLRSSGASIKFTPRSGQASLDSIPELPPKENSILTHYGDDDFIDTPGDHVFTGVQKENDLMLKATILRYRDCVPSFTDQQLAECFESFKEKNQDDFDEFIDLCQSLNSASYLKRGRHSVKKEQLKKEALEHELIIQILKIVAQGQQIKEGRLQNAHDKLQADLALSQSDCEYAKNQYRAANKKKNIAGGCAGALGLTCVASLVSLIICMSR